MPVLFHALNNELNASLTPSGDAATIEQVNAIGIPAYLAAIWLFAIVMWIVFGKTRLSHRPKVTATGMLENQGN